MVLLKSLIITVAEVPMFADLCQLEVDDRDVHLDLWSIQHVRIAYG